MNEYWQALMMAVDLRMISSLPTKSLIFCVITICIPLYLRIRLASWYIKSKATGYLGSINTWASSIATTIFLFVLCFILKSRFLIISLSNHFNTISICALAITWFLFARSDWKLNTVKFSLTDNVDSPFQRLAFLPSPANFET